MNEVTFFTTEFEKINQLQNSSTLDGHSFLIIGATGMIGSYLVDFLMWRNHVHNAKIKIYAMGRNKLRLEERFTPYLTSDFFELVEGDVTEPLPLTVKVDYVIHAASNTHPRAYATDPIGTVMTSLMGTKQVLDYAVAFKTERVIFLSTVEIYGENRGDVERFTEDYCGYIDCNTLRAGYPEGKRASESLCQAYRSKYGVDIVIPRICRTFGPTLLLNDSKAASQFLLKGARQENIVLKSQGEQFFSYAYVGDVVSALFFLLSHGESGEAYNIAVAEFDLRLKELAKKIATISDQKVIFDLPDAEEQKGFSKASKALLDPSKLQQLGWKSLFSLDESLRQTIESLQKRSLAD